VRRADHSFRGVLPGVLCIIVCDLETSTVRLPRPELAFCAIEEDEEEEEEEE